MNQNPSYEVKIPVEDGSKDVKVSQVSEVIESMLKVDPEKRSKISQVVRDITNIIQGAVGSGKQDDSDVRQIQTEGLDVSDVGDIRQGAEGWKISNVSERGAEGGEVSNVSEREVKGTEETSESVMLAVKGHHGRDVWMRQGKEWKVVSRLPEKCPADYMCFCIVSNTLLVAGGKNANDSSSSQCHALSLITLQWSKMPNLPTARKRASAAVLGNDLVIFMGGWEKGLLVNRDSTACESLNVKKKKWRKLRRLSKGLDNPLLAVMNGNVFILERSYTTSEMVVYHSSSDTYTNTASKLPNMARNIWRACFMRCGEHLYLLGGEERLSYQYSPLTDQWMQISGLQNQYDWGGCTAVTDRDTILLCGGLRSSCERDLVEKYNTETNQWTSSHIKLPFDFYTFRSFVCILPE